VELGPFVCGAKQATPTRHGYSGGHPSWNRNNPVYPINIANRLFKKRTKVIRNRLEDFYIFHENSMEHKLIFNIKFKLGVSKGASAE